MDYVVNFVNKNHDARKLHEQQNEALSLVKKSNAKRAVDQAARKQKRMMSIVIDIILVAALFVAIIIGFEVVYKDHFGPATIQGQVLQDLTPTQQLEMIQEVSNNG